MNLPTFIITGTIQQLIEIEPIIQMLGYSSRKFWNKVEYEDSTNIKLYNESNAYSYRKNIYDYFGIEIFKTTQIKQIINYIEKYKKENN